MGKMRAAVVTSFDEPPRYQEFDVPSPRTRDEVLVDVLAVGLHPRTRTGAAGTHYTSTGTLPMIPGIDGVGRKADGRKIFFVSEDDALGTMAEKAVVDVRRSIELPDDVNVPKVAAALIGRPAVCQLPPPGQRPRRRLDGGLPLRAAVTRRGDRRRHHRRTGEHSAPGRCREDLGSGGPAR